ncbi:MAG: cardiolipin synthase [Eubacteriales bacterium]|nr:cardiolipin synthase [Eubacteriales bacterium]
MSTHSKAKTHKKTWPFLRTVFSRTSLFIFFLAVQLIILWLAFTFLDETFTLGFFIVLSAIEVMFIMNQGGSSSFKIAWIVPIILFPVFGALFYLYLKIQSSVKRMRHRLDDEVKISDCCLAEDEALIRSIRENDPRLYGISRYLRREAHAPLCTDTAVSFYAMGEDFFPAFSEELKKAKKYIFMEYFIVAKGKIWDEILQILKEKAAEGVTVKFMFDGMNTIKNLPFGYDKELREMGIDCKIFSPVIPALATYQNNRDHRKICVIDGNTAFTGGLNLADEYANLEQRFGVWKDTGMMFKGDAAKAFSVLFMQMWNSTYRDGKKETYRLSYERYVHRECLCCGDAIKPGEGYVIPYGDSPLDEENVGENVYLNILHTARDYVHIMTPYLILDDQMMNALCFAAKRGVDVKILFPHIPDKPYAFWLGHSYYPELLTNGVRIFEYEPGFVHAKEFISDGRVGVIGTINLDFRSLYLHFENAAYLHDVPAILDMEADFQNCLGQCREIDMEAFKRLPWYKLLFGNLLKLIAPLF